MKLRGRVESFLGIKPQGAPKSDRQAVAAAGRLEDVTGELPDDDLGPILHSGDLPQQLAALREAADRALDERPFDVQLLGVLALSQGQVAELATGEGKTLVGAMAACLLAAQDRHVLVLAVNDYLAKRDAEWMEPLFKLLGVEVAWIDSRTPAKGRRAAYRAQVCYVPATELGFDTLRDRLVYDPSELVLGSADAAIVDEADSVLIDQAKLPLVLAGAVDEADADVALAALIHSLTPDKHYVVEQDGRSVVLTEEGEEAIEKVLDIDLYDGEDHGRTLTKVNLALHAEVLVQRDVDYLVKDGEVKLIDSSRGRVGELQRWPDGLQTAVEAKEGVAASMAGEVLDQMTIAELMDHFTLRSGMTGTAATATEEFDTMYKLQVRVIEPNMPSQRVDEELRLYATEDDKLAAIVSEIAEAHSEGRPVLIGTPSVADSEALSALLEEADVPHEVLNAKNDEAEAAIIAKAGHLGAVTVSTQMAGRGVDIKLGKDEDEGERVRELGGLLVIGTSPHTSQRLDNQLRGRAGRQGDPGTSVFFAAVTDPVIMQHDPISAARVGENGRVEDAGALGHVAHAQRVAEGQELQAYRNTFEYHALVRDQRHIMLEHRAKLLRLDEPERSVRLGFLDRAWADHLAAIADLREAMPLRSLSGRHPLTEFNTDVIEAFTSVIRDSDEAANEAVSSLDEGEEPPSDIPHRPSATWTYVVQDNPFGASLDRFLVGAAKKVFKPLTGE